MQAAANLKAYLDLCRVSNLPTVWTNVIAAALISGHEAAMPAVALAAAGISCFYLAGMALNDLCDREHDLAQRPSRPIPSGRIPLSHARAFTVSLFAAGFLLLWLGPYPQAVLAALLLLGVIVWYNRDHKQNPYSVLLMASCRFLVFAVAALAVTGRLGTPVILAGSLQFAYIVLLSLVARYENNRLEPLNFPAIPLMLAGISLLDGIMLAAWIDPRLLVVGVVGFTLTRAGQRYVRGD
jgi:4-hydroxybenzoate polyprenyltransferase